MLSYDEKVMKILNILIIESEMKVTYLKWLLKYFVSLVYIISKWLKYCWREVKL